MLDHYHEEKDENDEIYKSVEPDENFLLVRIPIDGDYLKENFIKHVKGGFSNWENEKVRTEIPDFWVLEEMNTINMYQGRNGDFFNFFIISTSILLKNKNNIAKIQLLQFKIRK